MNLQITLISVDEQGEIQVHVIIRLRPITERFMTEAEQIAMNLFPVTWVTNTDNPDFRIDSNSGRRGCAEAVAQHFLDVLMCDSTAQSVMTAFYRREHQREPVGDEVPSLFAKMGTALLAYGLRLKDTPSCEGCAHEYGLRLCEQCASEVNSI